MSLIEATRTCLRKYACFSGRASRREYWHFVLFLILGYIALGFLDAAFFGIEAVETAPGQVHYRSAGPLAGLFSLLTIVPLIAAGWRRMHDSGRSGLYLVYPVLVMIGIVTFTGLAAGTEPLVAGDLGTVVVGGYSILLLIAFAVLLISPLLVLWWLTRPSQPGRNRYGSNPHEVTS